MNLTNPLPLLHVLDGGKHLTHHPILVTTFAGGYFFLSGQTSFMEYDIEYTIPTGKEDAE